MLNPAYALARLTAALDGKPCPLRATEHLVDLHSDGTYAVMRFEGQCAKPGAALELGYNLFFDLDRSTRACCGLNMRAPRARRFSARKPPASVSSSRGPAA